MASQVIAQMLHESRRQVRPGKGLRDVKRHQKDAEKGRDLPRTPKGDFRGGAYEGPAGPDEKEYGHLASSESGQIRHKTRYPKSSDESETAAPAGDTEVRSPRRGGTFRGR